MKKLNLTKFADGTIGNSTLCTWPVIPGVTWIQTRDPFIARKLSQRVDSRLVVRGVAGGFLRTFEFLHGLAWATQLVTRYTISGVPTNGAFSSPSAPPRRRSRRVGTKGQLPHKLPGKSKSPIQSLATITAQNTPTAP